jgi:hypothetical protein
MEGAWSLPSEQEVGESVVLAMLEIGRYDPIKKCGGGEID